MYYFTVLLFTLLYHSGRKLWHHRLVSCLIAEWEVSKENLWSIYDTLAIAQPKQEEALFFSVPIIQ